MIVTFVVVMGIVFDQNMSVTGTITVEMDQMKLIVVSNYGSRCKKSKIPEIDLNIYSACIQMCMHLVV